MLLNYSKLIDLSPPTMNQSFMFKGVHTEISLEERCIVEYNTYFSFLMKQINISLQQILSLAQFYQPKFMLKFYLAYTCCRYPTLVRRCRSLD
jgi:hypothetical protein